MLDSNTILGTRGFLKCEEYEHGLLTQNNESWPCGTPVVYQAGILKNDRWPVSNIQAYVLMPPSQRAAGVEYAQVHMSAISPVGLKPLCKNHKVLTANRFDIGKFDRLLEFVRDVGGISLVIEYEEGRKAVAGSIRQIERIFGYSSLFYYNSWTNKFLADKEDRFVCVLTLLDIPYCMPLFNMRKVDGIGLSLSGAVVKASKAQGYLHRTFRADFIYSNYEDNVFFMDGIAINSMREPDSSIYDSLTKLSGQHFEIGKPDKKKEKKSSSKLTINTLPGSGHSITFPDDTPVSEVSASKWKTLTVLSSEPANFGPYNAPVEAENLFHNSDDIVVETTPEGMVVNTTYEVPWEFNSGMTAGGNNIESNDENDESDDEPEEGGT